MDSETKQAMRGAHDASENALENVFNDTMDASGSMARTSTVHIRQDIAGLTTLLMYSHHQLVNISRGIWLIAALIAALVVLRLR